MTQDNEHDPTKEETQYDVREYSKEEKNKLTRENKERAQELLKRFELGEKKKGKKLVNRVKEEVDSRKIIKYGSQNLAAGPEIYDADTIILVEGRADVANLLRFGIDNSIAIEGTNVSSSIVHLCRNRRVTALLDGDRGGDAILKELLLKTKIEFVARAPVGTEIENLSYEELQKVLNEDKKPVMQAEFIKEKISLVDFLKRNGRYNTYKN